MLTEQQKRQALNLKIHLPLLLRLNHFPLALLLLLLLLLQCRSAFWRWIRLVFLDAERKSCSLGQLAHPAPLAARRNPAASCTSVRTQHENREVQEKGDPSASISVGHT